ncbi:DUF3472 domain-containing protein [Formosa sp. S-31]|uniref:DUF3472 domain-containing protein n=1 Tax=Formosa sp. S-31 TaxID=2790949 RepID=UPI003EB8B1C5
MLKNFTYKLSSKYTLLLFSVFIQVLFSCASCTNGDEGSEQDILDDTEAETSTLSFSKTVPIGSNSWVINNQTQDQAMISEDGIHNWSGMDQVIHTYVKTGSGELQVGFKAKSADGNSKIKITIGETSKIIALNNTSYKTVDVGTFAVNEGYNVIAIQGTEKSGQYLGDISELLLGGTAVANGISFNPSSNHYFGRRGPSVHLKYDTPGSQSIKWFYNEVTVPEGEDQLGTFFMANGHSQGYFGMQVNSETERRVLFSIWSAFSTDDPNQIPTDYKVTSLGAGEGVTVKDFGNEGSGIQSFIDVDWKAGVTYKFLLKGEPAEVEGSTDYTGYFYDPEVGSWKLIASLRRPKTSTHLTGLHSFLENFDPSTGYQTRQGQYGNQWVCTTNGTWHEVTSASFTYDATAAAGDRLDYAGGTTGNSFFLKNCGFFNDNTEYNTAFSRTAGGQAPVINFTTLPQPVPAAEVTVLDRTNWSVIAYSSQEDQGGEGETGLAQDILDNNTATYWHSCWNGCSATPPHYLTIDAGKEITADGLRFIQRTSLSRAVKTIEIQVSKDNKTWTDLGEISLQETTGNLDTDFESPQTFRYLNCKITAAHDGTTHAAMAEIMAYTK